MAVYVVTGELGAGKSLVAVSRIQKALHRGRRVATNMDLRLEHLVGTGQERDVYRLPDHPTVDDLREVGRGYEGRKFDEKQFGLIVLDETATFINGRAWAGGPDSTKEEKQKQAKERERLILWLRHCRKFRWDLILISQDVESLDAQVRRALCEHVVNCRRLDRFAVPVVSFLTKLVGIGRIPMPQIHLGVVYYKGKHKVDTWYTPDARFIREGYDTAQKITGERDGAATMLDHRHAPYMWPPRGLYDTLWRAWLWKYLPPSEAQSRYDDFRLFEAGAVPPYRPAAQTFAQWAQARRDTAPEKPTRASGVVALVGAGEGEAAQVEAA